MTKSQKPTNRQYVGRPPLPDAERRECKLTVRLTSDERVALETAADAAGMRLGEFVRRALLAALR